MALGADKAGARFEEMLRSASHRRPVAAGLSRRQTAGRAPAVNDSPGRIRHAPFFTRMYGDCKNEVTRRLRR
jgi:hypothetical protein